MSDRPKLRPLDFQPVIYEEQEMWLLRDPLELTDYQLVLSPALAQMLIFFDGTRDLPEIQRAFYEQFGALIDMSVVEDTVTRLDEARLLDNERFTQAGQAQLQAYRAQPFRPPAIAGVSYPADPGELNQAFVTYGQEDDLDGWDPWTGRGIISPHIDYMRGGPVYAQVWRRAEAAVKQAELALIFGTDHNGSSGSVTLTHQPYATPYGVIPTEPNLINALVETVGPDVFEEELHHRSEHSVELSAVWLHHLRRQDPPPMVPILCGSFHNFVINDHHPDDDPKLTAFIETLRAETAGKRVLAVASVDLAHVGPAFGDQFIMDNNRRTDLLATDASLMEAIGQGDAGRFYREIAMVEDRYRICGFSSIYLMLRYLGQTQGTQIAYQHCPADTEDASLVSICGMLLD